MLNCTYFGFKSESINKWQINGTIASITREVFINFVTRILINVLLFVLQFLEVFAYRIASLSITQLRRNLKYFPQSGVWRHNGAKGTP